MATPEQITQASALQDPALTSVVRRPRSARRTSHIDMCPLESPDLAGLELHGGARDLVTDASGTAEIVALASLRAETGSGRERPLRRIETVPEVPGLQALTGQQAGPGFRAALDRAAPKEAAVHSPLYLLVDDIPVASLISGYADLYSRALPVAPGSMPPDICSGWRRDGVMMQLIDQHGTVPVPLGPAAPEVSADDPLAWHELPPLEPGVMRRQRLLDVAVDGGLDVQAMFRDTLLGGDGRSMVLHEYQLSASVELPSGMISSCVATPRVLPWPECPSAAASAADLAGTPVGDARRHVSRHLRGVGTCTHLNDLLRSLADVVPLASALDIDL